MRLQKVAYDTSTLDVRKGKRKPKHRIVSVTPPPGLHSIVEGKSTTHVLAFSAVACSPLASGAKRVEMPYHT